MTARRRAVTGWPVARLMAAVTMMALPATVLSARPVAAQTGEAINQILLANQTTWVSDGGIFQLGITVATPDPATARLQLTVYNAVTTRSDFTDSLAGRVRTGAMDVFDPVPLASLGATPELSVVVNPRAAVPTPSIHLTATGVYPVRVDLYDSSGNPLTQLTTHLLYNGADSAGYSRLDVAWVMPFTAAPGGAVASSAHGLLNVTSALADHPNVPLTVSATPETVDELAAGTEADRNGVGQLMQAVGQPGREVVSPPYVRLDLPAMLSTGLDQEVSTQLSTGAAELAANLHTVATSPTWIEYGPLTPAAVDDLAGRGVQRIIVADSSLTALPAEDRSRTLAQPFTVMGKTAHLAGAVVDAGLAAHFVNQGDQLLAAHQLLADLSMVQLELPNRRGGRGVVVVAPSSWQPNATFLATALDGLTGAPMLAPVTADQFFSDVTPVQTAYRPLVRQVAPAAQQPRSQPIAIAPAIRAARRVVTALAQEVPPTTPAIVEIQRDLLISESADLTDQARTAEVAAANELIDRLKGMVRLPGDQSITFTARQGLIPVTILSSAPYPVRVRVRVTSQKLGFRAVDLPGGACTNSGTSAICTVELRAQNTTVRVPVVAKTAGVFSLTVALDSPDGAINLATNQDTVRSTAASGVGVFLSVGAALLLMVWWVRDVVHGRRARRLMPTRFSEPTVTGAGGDDNWFGDVDLEPAGARASTSGRSGFRGSAGSGVGRFAPPGHGIPREESPTPGRAGATAGRAGEVVALPRPRPASWDDPSGLATQPIPIVIVDMPSETPQPPLLRPPTPRLPPSPVRSGAGSPRPPARQAPASASAAGEGSFSRNTAVMATGTLLSRVSGFGRVLALIWAFGIASGVTDVYNIANTAPNILYDLVLGGVLSATLVPVFVDYLGRDDPDEAWRAISAVVTAIAAALLGLSAAFWFATPAIIRFYQVLNHTAGAADQRAIGTTLLHMFVPQLSLLGGIAVTTALLNARRRFAAVAFSPVVNNVIAIVAIVAARMVASSVTLPGVRADQSALLILGLGTTAGYLFQFLVQIPSMIRAGVRLRPVWDVRHPAVRTVLRLSLWTFGSVIANQISFSLVLVLADHKRGDVTVFTTAYQFFQLPYAIFAVSIASVLTPDLSDHWAKRDLNAFRREMASGLRLTMAVLVPAAVGYVVLAQPFLHLVLNHGSFSAADAHRIGTVVALFAVGLPGFSAYLLLMRAYQAMQDTRSMFWLYLVENAATLVLAGTLYPVLGVSGLALGWVGAYSVGSIAAFAHLRRRTGGLDGQAIVAGVVRVALATVLMVLPVAAIAHLVKGNSDLVLLAQVGGGVVAGALVYLAAAQAFGVTELTSLLRRRRPA